MNFIRKYNFLAIMAALSAAIFVSGCGIKLKPDAAPISSIDAGYPTAEFRACGKLWNGLGVCRLAKGQDYDSINLQIQGYGTGTGSMRVDSKSCGINSGFTFNKNELVNIKIAGKAEKSCVVTFTVAPEYPKNAGVTIFPLRGHVLIRVTEENDDWVGWTFKKQGNWVENRKEYSGGDKPVRVWMSGCGIDYDKTLPTMNGDVTIPLQEAFPRGGQKICILDGNIINPVYQDLFFDYMIAQYDSSYIALPIPDVKVMNGFAEIKADPAVSILSINDKYVFESNATIHFDTTKFAILRALTVKGRNIIGVWDPLRKEWTWVQ